MPYPPVDFRSIPLFANVTDAEWNDWSWQIRNGIRDVETLEKVVKPTASARRSGSASGSSRWRSRRTTRR